MEYKTILIVDDSATSRMITKRCLDMAGFSETSYFEAEDGLVAMDILRDKAVDLILTDLNMPKMDGATFIKKLKIHKATREIPVVVISSMGNEALDEQLRKDGVEAVIRKPISPAKILESLEVE